MKVRKKTKNKARNIPFRYFFEFWGNAECETYHPMCLVCISYRNFNRNRVKISFQTKKLFDSISNPCDNDSELN